MGKTWTPALSFAILAVAVNAARGQAPGSPEFDAASIKPAGAGRVGGGLHLSPARIRVVNQSLKFCVQTAWNVKDFQVSGGSGWMESERYDIDADAAKPFDPGEFRTMLQALLADRFGLAVHRETKDMRGYALLPGKD